MYLKENGQLSVKGLINLATSEFDHCAFYKSVYLTKFTELVQN